MSEKVNNESLPNDNMWNNKEKNAENHNEITELIIDKNGLVTEIRHIPIK